MTPKQKEGNMSSLKQELDMDHHKIPLADLYRRFRTNPESVSKMRIFFKVHQSYFFFIQGLTHGKAKENRLRDGPNALTPPKKQSEWVRFARNLLGGFAFLLWVGAALCFSAYFVQVYTSDEAPPDNLYLGIVIAAVVFITGLFSYYQVKF
jgi:sodium/potassium-transporting ATPase subunit alpha